jgi:voltage-gated potassium channel
VNRTYYALQDTASQKIRSIYIALWVVVLLVLTSTVVFYVIGRPHRSVFDALWLTMQIITTTGDTGFDRTKAEEVWTVMVMVFGVLTVFYLGMNVITFIIDGELRQTLGRRRLEARIKDMQNHFIVCGFGRMGRALAEALAKKRAQFVIIDRSESAMQDAAELGYLHLHGDAMSEEVLAAARINDANGLASCLPEDSDNVFVVLTARDLNPGLRIIAKANYDEAHAKLRRAGADEVLSPSKLAADRAMTKFMLPAVDELLEIVVHGSDLEVSKVTLSRLPQAVGKALRDLALPQKTSLMVVAVVHDDGSRSFNPNPDNILRPGDELIVIGPEGGVNKLVEHYGTA